MTAVDELMVVLDADPTGLEDGLILSVLWL